MREEKAPIYIIGKDRKEYIIDMSIEEFTNALKNNEPLKYKGKGREIKNLQKVDDINYFLHCTRSGAKVLSLDEMKNLGLIVRCRCCNGEISIDYYKQGKNCPHCHRKVFSKYVKQVYLSLDYNNYFLQRLEKKNLYERTKDYELYTFRLSLDVGDISKYVCEDLSEALRLNQETYSIMHIDTDEVLNFASDLFRDLESYNEDVEIILCREKNNLNSLLNLYYLAPRLIKFKNVYEVEYNDENLILEAIKKKRKISKTDLKRYFDNFNKIAKEPSYFRILINNEVSHFKRNYFDDIALKIFTENFLNSSDNVPRELLRLMNEHEGFLLSYEHILLIIRNLLNEEKLFTSSRLGYGSLGCDYKDANYDIANCDDCVDFNKNVQAKLKKMFQLGSSHYIYNLLDENVIYHSLDIDKKVIGRDGVVNYLENVSIKLNHSGKDFGYSARVRNIDGKDVLLLKYPWGEVNRVDFTLNQGKIDKILVYEMKN